MTSTTAVGLSGIAAIVNGISSLSDNDPNNNTAGTILAVVGILFLAETFRQAHSSM